MKALAFLMRSSFSWIPARGRQGRRDGASGCPDRADAVNNDGTAAASKKIKVIMFGQKDANTVKEIVKALAEKV